MRCAYCYVNKEDLARYSLCQAGCQRAVDILFDQPGDEKLIKFMGGEPLLKFGLLKKVALYAKAKAYDTGKKLCLILDTNGTLLNRDRLSFLQQLKFIICLSLDGDKKTHDKNRKFSKGAGSTYKRILKNIDGVDRDKIIINYVVSPHLTTKFLANLLYLQSKGFNRINFRPDINVFWKPSDIAILKETFDIFTEFYIDSFRKKERLFFIPHIKEILNKELNYTNKWCKEIKLGPDGNFYSCCRMLSLDREERLRYSLGSLKSGIDNNKRTRFLEKTRREISIITEGKCGQCQLFKYCFCLIDLYLYCRSTDRDFIKYFQAVCAIAKIIFGSFIEIKSTLISEHNYEFMDMYSVIAN